MKHQEFYNKYKTKYLPLVNPIFSKRNWWRIILITLSVVLIEPLILYRHQKSNPFSLEYYLQVIPYIVYIVVPLVAFLFWANGRESLKRNRGYRWEGKFEVLNKQSSFLFCFLLLAPGSRNKIKVDRKLFEKVRVGDFVLISRDSLGNIEEVRIVNDFSSRLGKANSKRVSKPASLIISPSATKVPSKRHRVK